jgi:NAD(P)-dependent dehydrogenase (short-subunit alcohol dehydrogenase family)
MTVEQQTNPGVVLVTGAAQGLGLAISQRLARDGFRVAMVDRQAEQVMAAAGEIAGATPYTLDLLMSEQIEPLVQRVEDECGVLGGLVNNAGIVKTQDFFEATAADWEMVFGIHTRAPLLLMQAVGRRMVERKQGAIVNIASVAGRSARPQQTLYGASKAALLHLTKSAAAMFGPHGVRVNAVCPGVVQTEMTRQIWRERRQEDVEKILQSIPLQRTAPPEEIAAAVAWLLSHEASYVNGQALNVCGGLEMD